YVFFGPVFDAGSKAVRGVGTEALATVARASAVPTIAIGGVTPERVATCIAAGAHGVATMTNVLTAANPAAVIQHFQRCLEESCPT
ncbi:MAG: thiamine phosphate synthase, partial [Planctomycetota bacterium]